MIISTRGRYALRFMIDLAETSGESYVSLKTIAQRQGISLKYLERILPVLAQSGMIEGIQGKGGGYKLTRKPEEYTVGEILRLTEGDISAVSCIASGECTCGHESECRTVGVWRGLQNVVDEYLDGITVADLMCKKA